MCYPAPGPECEEKVRARCSGVSETLSIMKRLSRGTINSVTDMKLFTLWASVDAGHKQISETISSLSKYSSLNSGIISLLKSIRDNGARLHHKKLRAYEKTLVQIGQDILRKNPDEVAIKQLVQQMSLSDEGINFLHKKLNSSWFISDGVQKLQAYRNEGLQKIETLVKRMSAFDNNKHIVMPDTEDYQCEYDELEKEYHLVINHYGPVLTVTEKAKIHHFAALVNMSIYSQDIDEQKKLLFTCQKNQPKSHKYPSDYFADQVSEMKRAALSRQRKKEAADKEAELIARAKRVEIAAKEAVKEQYSDDDYKKSVIDELGCDCGLTYECCNCLKSKADAVDSEHKSFCLTHTRNDRVSSAELQESQSIIIDNTALAFKTPNNNKKNDSTENNAKYVQGFYTSFARIMGGLYASRERPESSKHDPVTCKGKIAAAQEIVNKAKREELLNNVASIANKSK